MPNTDRVLAPFLIACGPNMHTIAIGRTRMMYAYNELVGANVRGEVYERRIEGYRKDKRRRLLRAQQMYMLGKGVEKRASFETIMQAIEEGLKEDLAEAVRARFQEARQ